MDQFSFKKEMLRQEKSALRKLFYNSGSNSYDDKISSEEMAIIDNYIANKLNKNIYNFFKESKIIDN